MLRRRVEAVDRKEGAPLRLDHSQFIPFLGEAMRDLSGQKVGRKATIDRECTIARHVRVGVYTIKHSRVCLERSHGRQRGSKKALYLVLSRQKLAKMVCTPVVDGANVRPAWRLTDDSECSSLDVNMTIHTLVVPGPERV